MKKTTYRHIPQRTCIACRQVKAKRQLVRLVRVADGSVVVDTSGRAAGRGAYLCHLGSCWQQGLKEGCLERALRTSLSQESREKLSQYGETFSQGVAGGSR